MANALQQLLQAASNSAASNVSAPVDGLAWLLRKAGLDIKNPVGGSDWMAAKGLTAPVENPLLNAAGETLGLVAPIGIAAKAPQIAAWRNAVNELAESGAGRMPRGAAPRGAVVWHGSPHKFDAFDSSKIGTGEGAQAYGHGLYLADAPDTAKFYQHQYGTPEIREGGRLIDPGTLDVMTSRGHALSSLQSSGGSIDDAIAGLDGMTKHGPEYKAAADWLRANRGKIDFQHGNLYKVDLPDEQIAKMLDWDKPLSQQAPEVQKALQPTIDKVLRTRVANAPALEQGHTLFPSEMSAVQAGTMKGGDFYRLLHAGEIRSGKALPAAEKERLMVQGLQQSGLPGIRYLDGGSRSAGQGSSNYVVFPGNESLLQILERNGAALNKGGAK
jgi:hypothetical protein